MSKVNVCSTETKKYLVHGFEKWENSKFVLLTKRDFQTLYNLYIIKLEHL